MFDCSYEDAPSPAKPDHNNTGAAPINSFKNIRKTRKKNRLKRRLEKSHVTGKTGPQKARQGKSFVGPTKETLAKLQPDPLMRFRKQNILNHEQIWAFQHIRRAVRIITDGTQMRVSCYSNIMVQTSRFDRNSESDHEIRIKDHYSRWIDRMTGAQLQAGPVLDIIIDELSLTATDRKWGKRKGWAKSHLQASLNLYRAFSPSHNRNG